MRVLKASHASKNMKTVVTGCRNSCGFGGKRARIFPDPKNKNKEEINLKTDTENTPNFFDMSWIRETADYWIDSCQRSALFMNALRKRGNIYLTHMNDGRGEGEK